MKIFSTMTTNQCTNSGLFGVNQTRALFSNEMHVLAIAKVSIAALHDPGLPRLVFELLRLCLLW